jgi:hypothetical protein
MAFTSRVVLVILIPAFAAAGLLGGRQAPPAPLATLDFMAGCWRGPAGPESIIEEYYTAPSDNVMLGVSRYMKAGRVTGFEFTSIVREDTAIVVTPRPEGQQPAQFRVTKLARNSVVWENPAHDFPTLVAYRRLPGDTLVARIEGPGPQGTQSEEWRMTRVRCDR